MVVRSLFTGVSGLQSHFDKMDTLSNNISNVNTPGFKKSNVVFKSFLSQQTATATRPTENRGGTNPQSVGLGVQTGSVNLNMSQGQLERTGKNTDLAIQGDGFFTTREAGSNRPLYTRAGSFEFDADGKLVDPGSGNIVQGWNADIEEGRIQPLSPQGEPEDIQVTESMESIPGQATTFQDLAGNLNADKETGIDSVTTSYSKGNSSGEIRYEFQRMHPTKKQYQFEAKWTGNPPSGKQIGDTVTDQITGRDFEGVVELNEDDQVIGLYQNSDRGGYNGIAQVQVGRDESLQGPNQGTYQINDAEILARDQTNFLDDLDNLNNNMRIKMLGDVNGDGSQNFTVQWQDTNDEWNYFVQDGSQGPTGTDNTAGTGDTTPTDDNPWPNNPEAGLPQPDTDGDGISEFTPVVGTIGEDFRMQRDIDGDGNIERDGEFQIKNNFWQQAENIGVGDEITFKVDNSSDSTSGVFDQTGEESKQEFGWAGPDSNDVYKASAPDTVEGVAELSRVYNYNEANMNSIENSNSINDIANKEFDAVFNPSGNYAVGAQTSRSGDKGFSSNLVTGVSNSISSGDTEETITLDSGINAGDEVVAGDLLKISDTNDGNEEAVVVTSVNAGANEVTVSGFDDGGTPGNGGEFFNDYGGDTDTEIENLGQTLLNQNGSASFSRGQDQQLFVDTNVDADGDGFQPGDFGTPNQDYTNPDTEIGLTIASEDWSPNASAGDRVQFTVTEARSSGSSGRGFGVVQDGNGEKVAMFVPQDQSESSINFSPNQNDLSGIMDTGTGFSNLVADGGSEATAERTDDAQVQEVVSADAFDSQGATHTVNYNFEKQDDNTWMWHVEDPTPVDPDNPKIAGFGQVTFNEDGQVAESQVFDSKVAEDKPPPGVSGDLSRSSVYFDPPEETLQADPTTGQTPSPEPPDPVVIDPDLSGITQFSGESSVEIADQDGINQGQLTSLNFDQTGILQGSYSNGETRELSQLTVTQFQNPAGLSKEGGTVFSESANSGLAQEGTAGNGGRGTITPGSLERSNVELSAQFTQVISTQRGFQANTRTITTSDQMVQSVLQLI